MCFRAFVANYTYQLVSCDAEIKLMSTQEQNKQLVKTNKNTTRFLGFHKRPETHTFYVLISRVLDLVFKARIYLFILFIYLFNKIRK